MADGQKTSEVYITYKEICGPEERDNGLTETMEFSASTWMAALDAAYEWLKANRKVTHVYHV